MWMPTICIDGSVTCSGELERWLAASITSNFITTALGSQQHVCVCTSAAMTCTVISTACLCLHISRHDMRWKAHAVSAATTCLSALPQYLLRSTVLQAAPVDAMAWHEQTRLLLLPTSPVSGIGAQRCQCCRLWWATTVPPALAPSATRPWAMTFRLSEGLRVSALLPQR